MPESELGALALDIETNGQREPGVLFEGMVLDGWHRYLACEQAGLEFKSVEFEGADPVAFVLGKNLHRRHLTALQKAAAVVATGSWRKRGSATVADPSGDQSATVADLAKKADVSPRTIEHAKTAQEIGLGDEARQGTVTARQVDRVSKLSPKNREKAVKAIKEGGDAPQARKPKVLAADPKIEKLYEEVKAELVDTKEALAEMRDLAQSAKAFEEKTEFKEMQVLRLELRSCKRRRDELMRENGELKKQVAHWKKKADKK